jgi:hypothetical protein
MNVNIVRVHLVSGHSFDVDIAYMLENGVLETDNFEAAGEALMAVKGMIENGNGLNSTIETFAGDRSWIVIGLGTVVAYEEREVA